MRDSDAWRAPLGWLSIAAGGVFLIAGWYGVQGHYVVAAQLPYFLSGGIGGVALVLFGSFLLSSSDFRADRTELEALRQSLEVLEDELGEMKQLLAAQAAERTEGNGTSKRSTRARKASR